MVAAPEAVVPLEVGKGLATHAPTILMSFFAGFAIILILIGIIVFSTAKSKTPGVLLLMLGLLVGGGAAFVMVRSESSKKA